MAEAFNLEAYLTRGVEEIVAGILKASLKNPKGSAFLARYALASRRAGELRRRAEEAGEHIPPFLIASVTTRCNLRCAGCYARANDACCDREEGLLSDGEWRAVFEEAAGMGVGFILLAGGEPLMRRGVLEEAGGVRDILFPVFTNATLIDGEYAALFGRCRNLIPVLSIEGGEAETDERRGAGVYQRLMQSVGLLKESGILFGASVTVTKANIRNVTGDEFLRDLRAQGFKAVVYVDYVPVEGESSALAPEDGERAYLSERLAHVRAEDSGLLLIAFPGDEAASGGCLAAGRGFFHINARGGAEPCPFSPFSDVSVRDVPLRQALKSPLFTRLRDGNLLTEDHAGGCVLFEKRDQVQRLLVG
jgi:MoaA/NifB/PqqE/SkfB family radical SAM enzyme